MRTAFSKVLLGFCYLGGPCLLLTVLPSASMQEQNNNRRPRTVGSNQNTNQAPANSAPQEVDEGDVVRVETQLVSGPAVVTDRNGRPLAGLKLDNFVLMEDGKPQRLTNFATTETPFEIALVLDTSGSTRDEIGLIRDAAKAFIRALRPGDRVAVVGFKNLNRSGGPLAAVDVVSDLTDNRERLHLAIDDLDTSNGTPCLLYTSDAADE